MRSRHWSEAKLFKMLRRFFGITKPMAATMEEWRAWRIQSKKHAPFGYWLTEEFPHKLEWFPRTFIDPFYRIKSYYRNRFVYKTHVLPTGFKPGQYSDLSERMLYGMMGSLVDFVEVEKAWMENLTHFQRSREMGMKYLEWETTLDESPRQAEAAREVIAIYTWWKDVRPNRPDPYDASGWSEYYEKRRAQRPPEEDDDFLWMLSDDLEYDTKPMHKKIHEIEEQYFNEDQDYLVRLVKIRDSLWT